MLPFFWGVVAVATVGAYLLDDAESENERAREEYDHTFERSKKRVSNTMFHAQRKDALDKLFKIKKLKRKIADTIYVELKRSQDEMRAINRRLKGSKKELSVMFEQKQEAAGWLKQRTVQKKIDKLKSLRKELFLVKENQAAQLKEIKVRLRSANYETRMVQEEIDRILQQKAIG